MKSAVLFNSERALMVWLITLIHRVISQLRHGLSECIFELTQSIRLDHKPQSLANVLV